jgi:hypothetical protein
VLLFREIKRERQKEGERERGRETEREKVFPVKIVFFVYVGSIVFHKKCLFFKKNKNEK